METEFKAVIVVPTIREANINDFLAAWEQEFRHHTLIIVEDNPERSFKLAGSNVEHYSWKDIDSDLGKDAWIIPRRTDCVRSYGYFKAFQKKPDMMVTLDDDCYPLEGQHDFLKQHWERLNQQGQSSAWISTLEGVIPRGVPYYASERTQACILNHGLWNNVPDFDAPTQLLQSRYPRDLSWTDKTIPVGSYFPMCGMNVAIRPQGIPAFYFLLMGRGYDYDRFGDIWAGIVIKKIADHLGWSINSGRPAIKHLRASSVWANLRKEAPGLEINEVFWSRVDAVTLHGGTFGECYKEIAAGLKFEGEYWDTLRRAMHTWADLFAE